MCELLLGVCVESTLNILDHLIVKAGALTLETTARTATRSSTSATETTPVETATASTTTPVTKSTAASTEASARSTATTLETTTSATEATTATFGALSPRLGKIDADLTAVNDLALHLLLGSGGLLGGLKVGVAKAARTARLALSDDAGSH